MRSVASSQTWSSSRSNIWPPAMPPTPEARARDKTRAVRISAGASTAAEFQRPWSRARHRQGWRWLRRRSCGRWDARAGRHHRPWRGGRHGRGCRRRRIRATRPSQMTVAPSAPKSRANSIRRNGRSRFPPPRTATGRVTARRTGRAASPPPGSWTGGGRGTTPSPSPPPPTVSQTGLPRGRAWSQRQAWSSAGDCTQARVQLSDGNEPRRLSQVAAGRCRREDRRGRRPPTTRRRQGRASGECCGFSSAPSPRWRSSPPCWYRSIVVPPISTLMIFTRIVDGPIERDWVGFDEIAKVLVVSVLVWRTASSAPITASTGGR